MASPAFITQSAWVKSSVAFTKINGLRRHGAEQCMRVTTSIAEPQRFVNAHFSRGVVIMAGTGKRSKKASKDDPWETLFQQLEKDLENDPEDSADREITEEDMETFERELDMVNDIANAQSTGNNGELDDLLAATSNDGGKAGDDRVDEDCADSEEGSFDIDEYDDEDFSDDEIEEPRLVNLEKWQLRKLAAAVELGRRKVNIKSLAADLKLDRDDVLFFLKSPPPELLLLASQLEEERKQWKDSDEEGNGNDDNEEGKDVLEKKALSRSQADSKKGGEDAKREYGRRDWVKGKRIKKVHLATLQRVYGRTKRPTNAMVESLVRATNLPHRRVVEWFEEERAKLGIRDGSPQRDASRKIWTKPVTHTFARPDS